MPETPSLHSEMDHETDPDRAAPEELSEDSVNSFNIQANALAGDEIIPANEDHEYDRRESCYRLPDGSLIKATSFETTPDSPQATMVTTTEMGPVGNRWEDTKIYLQVTNKVWRKRWNSTAPEKRGQPRPETSPDQAERISADARKLLFFDKDNDEIVDQADLNATNSLIGAVLPAEDKISYDQYLSLLGRGMEKPPPNPDREPEPLQEETVESFRSLGKELSGDEVTSKALNGDAVSERFYRLVDGRLAHIANVVNDGKQVTARVTFYELGDDDEPWAVVSEYVDSPGGLHKLRLTVAAEEIRTGEDLEVAKERREQSEALKLETGFSDVSGAEVVDQTDLGEVVKALTGVRPANEISQEEFEEAVHLL